MGAASFPTINYPQRVCLQSTSTEEPRILGVLPVNATLLWIGKNDEMRAPDKKVFPLNLASHELPQGINATTRVVTQKKAQPERGCAFRSKNLFGTD
jgi:hypothetical protein